MGERDARAAPDPGDRASARRTKRASITATPETCTGMSQTLAPPSSPEPSRRRVTGRYDTRSDVLSVRFGDAEAVASREVRPGLRVAYDAAGAVAGIEILAASAGGPTIDRELRRLVEAA